MERLRHNQNIVECFPLSHHTIALESLQYYSLKRYKSKAQIKKISLRKPKSNGGEKKRIPEDSEAAGIYSYNKL